MSFKPDMFRSKAFFALFVTGMLCITVMLYPITFISSKRFAICRLRWVWLSYVGWLARHIAGITVEVDDPANLLSQQAIFTFNHQSNWESFHCYFFIKSIVSPIAKISTKKIPLYNRCYERCGGLFIDRRGSKENLQSLIKQGSDYIENHQHSIYICPEGTRKPYGTPYKSLAGIYFFYKAFKLPVVPVAHNSGLVWSGLASTKAGTVKLVVSREAIKPGLDKKEFLQTLDQRMQALIDTFEPI